MRILPELFDELTESLRILPGVGPRSAQRMALYLLNKGNRSKARDMARVVHSAMETIQHCTQCRNYTDQEICTVCTDDNREKNQLCIVETPSDLIAIEAGASYRGKYFVLMGKLSPLDGIGPKELGIDMLMERITHIQPKEIILALNATVEGEVTCHYLSEMLADNTHKITRIAQGIPTGGNLEYLDTRTLLHAFDDRKQVS